MAQMSFQRETTIDLKHPALQAWKKLSPANWHIESIDSLKKPNGMAPHIKSSVYRLHGANAAPHSIIAKRTSWPIIQLERMIYQEILPGISIDTIKCYGVIRDAEETGWIFLEEAIGDAWIKEDPQHMQMAAQWLATLHITTSALKRIKGLPDRQLPYYAGCLDIGMQNIKQNLNNPELSDSDVLNLKSTLGRLDYIKSRWKRFPYLMRDMPLCMVHSDIAGKNIRVDLQDNEKRFWVLDWEFAGWGTPAVDIPKLQPQDYWLAVRSTWPHISLRDVEMMNTTGIILKSVFGIWGRSYRLSFEWTEGAVKSIRVFDGRIIDALEKFENF